MRILKLKNEIFHFWGDTRRWACDSAKFLVEFLFHSGGRGIFIVHFTKEEKSHLVVVIALFEDVKVETVVSEAFIVKARQTQSRLFI